MGVRQLWFRQPFKTLVNTAWYNRVYHRHLDRVIEGMVRDPIYINIETTNGCNASCIMCPHESMQRAVGTMSMELFQQIVDEVVETQMPVKMFVVSGFGEPLLDRHIADRIRYIKSKGNYYTKFHTNAALMVEKKAQEILDSGLDELAISFNAVKKESYEQVMRFLNYDKVLKNVLKFLELKETQKRTAPRVMVSCIKLDANAADIREVKKFWEGKVDQVVRPVPENWAGGIQNKSKWIYWPSLKEKMWPCRSLWDTLDIQWNGQVALCCRDYEGKEIIQKVGETPLKEILEKKRRIGYAQKGGDWSVAKLCHGCDTALNNSVTWWH